MRKSAWKKYGAWFLSLLIAAALYAIINKLDKQQYLVVNANMSEDAPRILVLDPGHGGEDGGAVSADGLIESGVNLDIALRMRELCGFLGVRCVMTREGEELDYPPELTTTAARKRWDTRRRTELINAQSNAVLLSIHQNHYPSAQPRGPQAFYGGCDGSRLFAELVHTNLVSGLLPDSRRVAAPVPKEVYIMSNADCTAVLVECGFLSHPVESTLLRTDTYKTKIAAILMASYLQYMEADDESQNNILLHGVRQ